MKVVVTGGAGFIGSYLVDELMTRGYHVTVIDNLSSGKIGNIDQWLNDPGFNFVEADLKQPASWIDCFKDVDEVYHYAANPEVRVSVTNPEIHFRENLESTFNILESCRKNRVPHMIFASTSTVYGEPDTIPTPESYQPLEPISVYGAVKLACEMLTQTYTKLYPIRALTLRYANVIGPRSTHGVIIDFINKLKANPKQLEILGDGTQRKSYLYIEDAIEATMKAQEIFRKGAVSYDVYNIGSEDQVSVVEIADIITEEMGLENVEYVFKPATRDGRGWPGDVKIMLLGIKKIKTGWQSKYNSRQAVEITVKKILEDFR
ncbi:MAG: NAD-dependent epimerase/dehydratase family protein [Candidatus Bathyarchaeia archaeon]